MKNCEALEGAKCEIILLQSIDQVIPAGHRGCLSGVTACWENQFASSNQSSGRTTLMRVPLNRATSKSFPQRSSSPRSSQHQWAHLEAHFSCCPRHFTVTSHDRQALETEALMKCHLRANSRNCGLRCKQTNARNCCGWIVVVLRNAPCMWNLAEWPQ